MKREVSMGVAFPHSFASIVAKSGKVSVYGAMCNYRLVHDNLRIWEPYQMKIVLSKIVGADCTLLFRFD